MVKPLHYLIQESSSDAARYTRCNESVFTAPWLSWNTTWYRYKRGYYRDTLRALTIRALGWWERIILQCGAEQWNFLSGNSSGSKRVSKYCLRECFSPTHYWYIGHSVMLSEFLLLFHLCKYNTRLLYCRNCFVS